MKRILGYGLVVLVVLLVAAQLVPYGSAENPPVETDIAAPEDVRQVLRRACYDCHSNETVWPWYSHVAPAKWLVRHDVEEGREHLNFSTWNRYDAEERDEAFEEVVEVMDEGEMPPAVYTPLHADARLTDADRALIRDWAMAQGGVGGEAGERSRAGVEDRRGGEAGGTDHEEAEEHDEG